MSHLNLLSEHKVSVEEKFLDREGCDEVDQDQEDQRPEAGGDGGVLVDVDAQVAEFLVFRRHRLTIQAPGLTREDSLRLINCHFEEKLM